MLSNYLHANGQVCTFCGGTQTYGDALEPTEKGVVLHEMRCSDCGGEWEAHYELTGVVNPSCERISEQQRSTMELQAWESYRCAALSTAHLCRKGVLFLNAKAAEIDAQFVMKRDTGWFIKLGGSAKVDGYLADMIAPMPKSLQDILSLAAEHGIGMVEIDADAPEIDTLPTYEDALPMYDPTTVNFALADVDGSSSQAVTGFIESHTNGIKVWFDDHVCPTGDSQVFIENYNDETRVVVWADAAAEDPTHEIVIPRTSSVRA